MELTAVFCLDSQPTIVAANSKLPDIYSIYDFNNGKWNS